MLASFLRSSPLASFSGRAPTAQTPQPRSSTSRSVPHPLVVMRSSSSDDAVQVVTSILASSRDGSYDSLLEFLPDDLIDRTLRLKKEFDTNTKPEDLELLDCLKFGRVLENDEGAELKLDPFALRSLVFQGPSSYVPLSNIRLDNATFLRRVSCETYTGERLTLTFVLKLEDSLVARYKGVRIEKRWVLREVRGEASEDAPPSVPSKTKGPESVVEAQLQALRQGDFSTVFAFASPSNKAATGPLERFAQMIVYSPAFKVMVGHDRHTVLRTMQPNADQHFQVVKLFYQDLGSTESKSACFLWMLRIQHDDPSLEGAWMVEGVQPLGDVNV